MSIFDSIGNLHIYSGGFTQVSELWPVGLLLTFNMFPCPCAVKIVILLNISSETTEPISTKKGKRKVQGVPQSQTATLPRPQEEEKPTNLNKHKPNKRTKNTKISSLFPKRGLILLLKCDSEFVQNNHTPLTFMPIYSSSKLRTA